MEWIRCDEPGSNAGGVRAERRYRFRERGSRASRRPSPMRLVASTVAKRKDPAKTEIHQACCSLGWPLLTMLPHVGVRGGTPAPRKDSDASERIANATTNVPCTINGDSELAKM